MSNYAIQFEGHGTFTPDGRIDGISDIDAHNREVERLELEQWTGQPTQAVVYVKASGGSSTRRWRPQDSSVLIGDTVTTWLGTVLGTIASARTYQHNFGSRMTSIRFKGTNGAVYYGRYGSDWSEACKVRKAGVK